MTTITAQDVNYYFTYEGVNFRSRVALSSPLLEKILNLPKGAFEEMNLAMIEELWEGDFSPSNIEAQLKRLNENGSHAFVELA
jgi:hypothetical protein